MRLSSPEQPFRVNRCDPIDWAYMLVGVSRRIYLSKFLGASGENRALTLIHEAAHLYYGLEDAGGGAGLMQCTGSNQYPQQMVV
ncbi:MAG: hypothetical protein K8R34_15455 [Methanosarcinales archaeon]|nr:hypothetical protein [Methanosarcinales archaeon]MCD4810887.1 hypothetical protein [Methanosarcinales archaeon]